MSFQRMAEGIHQSNVDQVAAVGEGSQLRQPSVEQNTLYDSTAVRYGDQQDSSVEGSEPGKAPGGHGEGEGVVALPRHINDSQEKQRG